MYDIFNAYNIEEFLEAFADFFGVLGTFSSLLSLVLFIIKGIGLYRMANTLSIKNAWLSFIPFADLYMLGTIASKYIKRDGSKSAKFGIILPVFYAVAYIITIAFTISFVVLCLNLIVDAEEALMNPNSFSITIADFIPSIVLFISTLVLGIVYKVLLYVSLWRIFAIFDSDNATIFLVLSIIFSPLVSIFVFVMRNNTPALYYEARNEYFEVEKM